MLCVVLSLACVVTMVVAAPMSDVDSTWTLYKQTHGKKYQGDVEIARKIVFMENLEYINSHNLEADLGQHSYWLGLNEYTDWSNAEFRYFMNGYKFANKTSTGSTFLSPENIVDLPGNVDWRLKGFVTPIKNQKQCGSCWSFSATGALEGQHFRKTGNLVSLSEQNLVDCSVPEGDHGCNGGLMDFAFIYVQKNHGIDTEQCYPYEASQNRCRFRPSCVGATCTGHVDIPHGNELALRIAVATIGPVSVGIDATHRSFQLYKRGVYDEPRCSPTQLDHGVLAVGYGTSATGQDYWIVKNSWGETWGDEGYIRMSRNKHNQCGIATSASYPLM